MKRLPVLALLCLVACGLVPDPRDQFVGTWKGPASQTLNGPGGSNTVSGEETIAITESTEAGKIVITGDICTYKATVKDEVTFAIDASSCTFPVEQCSVNLNTSSGSGTRTGTNLKVSLAANFTMTCGSQSANGTATTTVDATKQ